MSQVEPEERDPLLERNGWTRRFTAIGARLDEAIELYRGLGYQIRLEPAERGSEEAAPTAGCEQCFVMTLARTIYTRPVLANASARAAERQIG
ncbi:MAG TPA: hypothetical protein VKQ30_06695 [Ktedonobacterales bacterium]|nr:hypothetical protein [Ktedonobacterales bacterium]